MITRLAGTAGRGRVLAPALALMDAYRPRTDRFFASPSRTMLARGVHREVPHDARPLPDRVRDALGSARAAGVANPLVIGAIPFDRDGVGTLVVPETVRLGAALRTAPPAPPLGPVRAGASWHRCAVPSPEGYADAVRAAVRHIRAGTLDKVVLARALDVRGDRAVDIRATLRVLAARDPHGFVFGTPSPAGRVLLGASPETLLVRHGAYVMSQPMAGSRPRGADPAEDERNAAALLASAKDRHEHHLVVDAVRAALAPYCVGPLPSCPPALARTATLWHLASTITGELVSDRLSALDLACRLHPTPAVCGTPVGVAREVIRELEPFDRGLYTGLVGWCDAAGNGEWAVTIRCAEVGAHRMRLFAGAGVVADSCPATETLETEAKFGTFLGAAVSG